VDRSDSGEEKGIFLSENEEERNARLGIPRGRDGGRTPAVAQKKRKKMIHPRTQLASSEDRLERRRGCAASLTKENHMRARAKELNWWAEERRCPSRLEKNLGYLEKGRKIQAFSRRGLGRKKIRLPGRGRSTRRSARRALEKGQR